MEITKEIKALFAEAQDVLERINRIKDQAVHRCTISQSGTDMVLKMAEEMKKDEKEFKQLEKKFKELTEQLERQME